MAGGGNPRRDHWEKVFREKNETEVSWFQERPTTSLELIARTEIDRRGAIVDVGGGASRLVDGLFAAGYRNLTVVDISEAALAKSRERMADGGEHIRWVVTDLLQWTPDPIFDVWHDRAVFHFMLREVDQDAYRATLLRAVKVGGHAVIATFDERGPEKCSGLPVQRWEPETLATFLAPELELVESFHEGHVTPAARVQTFQFSRFQRRS